MVKIMMLNSINTNHLNDAVPKSNNIREKLPTYWKTAKKVGCIALGAIFDFADGLIRSLSVQVGIIGGILIVTGLAIPLGLQLLITSIFVYYISKKLISEKAAPACYTWGGVDRNSHLRMVPFMIGVGASFSWLKGFSLTAGF
jgi:hypothetical protein